MLFTLFLATILIVRAFSPKRYPPCGVIHRRSFETLTSAALFISQHAQDDKQKLTREGMGNLYQTPKATQLKLETSRITFKNAWLPLFFIWSYESVVPIEHMINFVPREKII